MTWSGNTVPYKTEWIKAYQETHYRQPVFPVFADMKFSDILTTGQTIKWSYDADIDAGSLGTDGSYIVENRTVTDETLTVNQTPDATFVIPATQRIQDHRPTQQKWATKAMNKIFWKVDSNVLGQMVINAASSLDASDAALGTSSAGTPITVTSSNAAAVFSAARRKLRNQNIIYDENKKWSGDVKLDAISKYPVCAIPPELEEALLLAIGFKPGEVGDQVLTRGFIDKLFGFNTFVSTSLPFSFKLAFSGTPTDTSTLTIGGLVFTWETGSIDTAGKVKAETSEVVSVTNLCTFINAGVVASTGGATAYGYSYTRTNLTIAQRMVADMLYAVDGLDGTCTIYVFGGGRQTVSQTDGAGTISNQAVHALFGVSQSIAMCMQKTPELAVSAGQIIGNGATGGYVAQHFVTWALLGYKVFKTHTFQLVDVLISTTGYSNPQGILY